MECWELRRRRTATGLTQRQIARAAGTSVSNVSAYERGAKRPSERTARRLAAMIAAGRESPVHRAALLTIPAAAAAIRRDVRRGDVPTADTLRYVRESINNARFVIDSDADWQAFFAEPSTTGDPRWDAMLAGVASMLADRYDRERPSWTAGREVRPFWFVGSTPALHAYAFAHSPPWLALRGVFVDPADLESV